VVNGSVNVASGFDSEDFKNRIFLTKLDISNQIHTFLLKTAQGTE
jgi:hypothetical protein